MNSITAKLTSLIPGMDSIKDANHLDTIQYIPFSQLVASASNVRKTPTDPRSDSELRASIETQGLLQNLVVTPTPDSPSRYEVTAGGRRLKIIGQIIADKTPGWDEHYPLPCLIKNSADAANEASLTENICREEMHPADQFDAYLRLHLQYGFTVEEIAKHFGKSVSDVRKALLLGRVAEPLRDEFRAGKIGLDEMTAFTLCEDLNRQVEVYAMLKRENRVFSSNIRKALRQSELTANHKHVKFVTLEHYLEEGGTVSEDIFMNEQYILQPELIDRLMIDKLEAEQTELLKFWKWAHIETGFQSYDVANYVQLEGTPNAPKELTDELEALKAQEARINEAYDSETEDQLSEQDIEAAGNIEELVIELQEKIERYQDFTDEQQAVAGCVLSISDKGELVIYKGLQRSEDIKEAASDSNATDSKSSSAPASKAKSDDYSQSLRDDISKYRHVIAKRALIKSAKGDEINFAVSLLHFQICYEALASYGYWSKPFSIQLCSTDEDTSKNDIKEQRAFKEFKERCHDLELNWIEKDPAKAFQNFCELDQNAVESLLAYSAATTLNRTYAGEKNDWLGLALQHYQVNLSSFWIPTKENFFSRVTKAVLLKAGAFMSGDQNWGKRHEGEKNGILAEQLSDRAAELANSSPQLCFMPEGMSTE